MTNLLWNLKAKFYLTIRKIIPFNLILKSENRNIEILLRSFNIKGKKVIDLGTGTGNILRYLKNSGFVLGIDRSLAMLLATKQIYPEVILIQADTLKLAIKKNSFELITAVGLSEYLKDINFLFKEVYRVLKNNGFFLMTFSPSGIWTRLRLLLGLRVYPRTLEEIVVIAEAMNFRLVRNDQTLMQAQVLFQKL
ncbi:MAG: class I SAM-dependent methyltransferase [bacterium]|nr:MAG: class I SAM-dependent methyltransferase [bacterium]